MKIFSLVILALGLSFCLAGCPFKHGKEEENFYKRQDLQYANQKQTLCGDGQVLINDACVVNDIQNDHYSEKVWFNEDCFIQWQFPDGENIEMFLQLNVRSWVGITFKTGMEFGDMAVFQIDDFGAVYGWVAWSEGQQRPNPYPDQSMFQVIGYEVSENKYYPYNGIVKVKFLRKIDTGIKKWSVLCPNCTKDLAVAYNKNPGHDQLQYHNIDKGRTVILKDQKNSILKDNKFLE